MTKPASTTNKPRKQHTPESPEIGGTHWGGRCHPRA
ncbi:Fis family transcriptional regulator [Salmonella enterica subsp. enterica serovar Krefeld str. SA20030536]|nr:Fis family transcriptional regulator [Salmonella enterica subsp. enterica serovar Krefeld str. SA20030536]